MAAIISSLTAIIIILTILPIVIVCIAYPYLALRVRDSREEKRDPELGVKTAYYMMLSAAIVTVLMGLTIFAVDIMDGAFEKGKKGGQAQQQGPFVQPRDKEDDGLKNVVQRTAWGLIVAGVLFALTFMLVLKIGTNDVEYPAAKRVFVGGRLALVGVIVMIALTALIVLVFIREKDLPSQIKNPIYEALTGILMVWVPALAVHIFLMRLYAKQPYHVERSSYPTRSRRDEEMFDDD